MVLWVFSKLCVLKWDDKRCQEHGFGFGGSKTLIGVGDTLEAMKRAGVTESEVSHVSTGGATLRFLAADEMPGLNALENR